MTCTFPSHTWCLKPGDDLSERMCICSALAVLASGSGVSTERETFMDLVKTEITRLNGEVSNRGSMSMTFHHGGVHVSLAPCHPLASLAA